MKPGNFYRGLSIFNTALSDFRRGFLFADDCSLGLQCACTSCFNTLVADMLFPLETVNFSFRQNVHDG